MIIPWISINELVVDGIWLHLAFLMIILMVIG